MSRIPHEETTFIFLGIAICLFIYRLPDEYVSLSLIFIWMVVLLLIGLLAVWRDSLNIFAAISFQGTIAAMYIVDPYRLYGWDSPFGLAEVNNVLAGNPVDTIPGFHYAIAIISILIGVSPEVVLKYVPFITVVTTTTLVILAVRSWYGSRWGATAGVLLASAWFFTEFHSWSVKETYALPPLVVCFYILIRSHRGKKQRFWTPIFLIVCAAIIITHHLVTTLLMLAMFAYIVRHPMSKYLTVLGLQTNDVSSTKLPVKSVFSLIIIYWTYLYKAAILAIFQPLIRSMTGSFAGRNSVSGLSHVFVYNSWYSHLQLAWRGGWYQAPIHAARTGIIIILAVLIVGSILKERISSPVNIPWPMYIFGFILVFWAAAYPLTLASPIIGGPRLIGLGFLISMPVATFCIQRWSHPRLAYVMVSIIVLISVVTLPSHLISNTISPDREAGQLGNDFKSTDYASLQWHKNYGNAPISADTKHIRFFKGYEEETLDSYYLQWVFGTNRPVNETYWYDTPSSRELLILWNGRTRSPPNWPTRTDVQKIYTTGGAHYYLKG